MTTEHLRPLLTSPRDLHLLYGAGEMLARGEVLDALVDMARLDQLIALQKRDGGVRGIVAGDVVQRLDARTVAHAAVGSRSGECTVSLATRDVDKSRLRVCGARPASVVRT